MWQLDWQKTKSISVVIRLAHQSAARGQGHIGPASINQQCGVKDTLGQLLAFDFVPRPDLITYRGQACSRTCWSRHVWRQVERRLLAGIRESPADNATEAYESGAEGVYSMRGVPQQQHYSVLKLDQLVRKEASAALYSNLTVYPRLADKNPRRQWFQQLKTTPGSINRDTYSKPQTK